MATQQALKSSINELMRQQLAKFHCTRGHLRYQPDVLSFSGWQEDDKPVSIREPHKQLGFLISQYIEGQPDWAGLLIEANLSGNDFDYKPVFAAALKQEAKKLEQERQDDPSARPPEL